LVLAVRVEQVALQEVLLVRPLFLMSIPRQVVVVVRQSQSPVVPVGLVVAAAPTTVRRVGLEIPQALHHLRAITVAEPPLDWLLMVAVVVAVLRQQVETVTQVLAAQAVLVLHQALLVHP
jgi:hypothetical protein